MGASVLNAAAWRLDRNQGDSRRLRPLSAARCKPVMPKTRQGARWCMPRPASIIATVDDAELRRLPLLSELDDAQLDRMRVSRRLVELPAGETLFHMGDRSSHFYYLDSGAIKLFRISPTGQEKIVEIIRPGQTFAEAVMFFARPLYPVNAQALESSTLTTFDSKVFLEMLHQSTETCLRLLGTLSVRLHQRVNEIDALSLQNATLRVVNFLLARVPDAVEEAGHKVIELEAAKKDIAGRLSIQPETFSRVLHALSESGAVRVEGRCIRVISEQALRNAGYHVPGTSAKRERE
jgi:CRP-like cAMP-binding protein